MYKLPSVKFGNFQPLFQMLFQFSPLWWHEYWLFSYSPIGPWNTHSLSLSFFLSSSFFKFSFSLSFRLGSFSSVFWFTDSFLILNPFLDFYILIIIFFSSEIAFWFFFVSCISLLRLCFLFVCLFFYQDTAVMGMKIPAVIKLSLIPSWWEYWDALLHLGGS